ncbi:MAG: glycosyltransferase [Bacteroidota bacterium]
MNTSLPKMLLVAHYQEGMGFTRVANHFKNAAKAHFEIHQYAYLYKGGKFIDEDGIHIHPDVQKPDDQFGAKAIGKLLGELQPDLFFIIFEISYVRFVLEALRYKTKPVVSAAYLAVDGLLYKRRKMLSKLSKLDMVVWYTHATKNHVEDLLTEQPSLLPSRMPFFVIPHGVETNFFYPINTDPEAGFRVDRTAIKKEMFPTLSNVENTFIVFNGNRIDPRKNIEVTIEGFAKFAADKPEGVKLYLHKLTDKDLYYHQMIKDLGIEDRIIHEFLDGQVNYADNATLNKIYNACDVGINTCTAEGWGLVSCEHGATGAPQILPKHTAFPEIWDQAAEWIVPEDQSQPGYTPHFVFDLDSSRVAEALEKLYRDKPYYQQKSSECFQRMNRESLQWASIEKQWGNVLQRLFTYS